MKTPKTIQITAELDLDKHILEILGGDSIQDALEGQVIKVKSGVLENAMIGWITSVTELVKA